MRIRWYDRLLFVLSGALLFALGLLLIMTGLHAPRPVYDFGIKLTQAFLGLTVVHWIRDGAWYVLAVLMVIGLALALWGVRQWISLIPKRQKETFFTATEVEKGTLTIARPALEHLVQKCVSEHPEMTVSKINIMEVEQKTIIRLRATMRSGVSMPKVTSSLQKEIIAYMSECAGIAVSSVQVVVEDTTQPLLLPEGKTPTVRALPDSTPEHKNDQQPIPLKAPEPVPLIEPPAPLTTPVQTVQNEEHPLAQMPYVPVEESTPEPEAMPIPLGRFVDEERAIPVLSSLTFPGEAIIGESDESDVLLSDDNHIGNIESSDSLDPMFSFGQTDKTVNGEEDDGDTLINNTGDTDNIGGGDIHAV